MSSDLLVNIIGDLGKSHSVKEVEAGARLSWMERYGVFTGTKVWRSGPGGEREQAVSGGPWAAAALGECSAHSQTEGEKLCGRVNRGTKPGRAEDGAVRQGAQT